MQGHIQMKNLSVIDFEYSMKKIGELGLEIQITKLDIDLTKKSDEDFYSKGKDSVEYLKCLNVALRMRLPT